jgi:predicted dehydrogenase
VGKIRVGVVGVGYLGQFHAEKYANMEGVELVGVVDIDPSRAKEVAQRCRTQPFSRHSQLFDKVQAVSIAVPTSLHYPITKEFFLQGIDALVEKPVTRTLEEADDLIALADSKHLVFQVGHLERFNSAFTASEGMAQNPLYIESHRLSPFPGRGTDVNVILDLMIHDIDIALSLAKSKVREIHAVGIPLLTSHSDIANAWIEFENGCVANLMVSRVSEEKTRKTRLVLPQGTLSVDFLVHKASFSKRVTPPGKGQNSDLATAEIPVIKADSLETEIHSFLESVRERKEAGVSGREARMALEVAHQIIQKIDERFVKK